MNVFEKKFLEYVKKNNLIKQKDLIIVAYSGGLDSTCLLYLLSKFQHKLNINLCALYVNHNIRSNNELKNEINIIKQNCEKLNINLLIKSIDVISYAKQNNFSTEEAARILRYQILYNTLNEIKFNKIATAHHLNDLSETIILKLIKGTSPSGMVGIYEKNNNIIRPLLFANKYEIEEYVKKNNLIYSFDSTNQNINIERNFIRHKIIPLFEQLNPNFNKRIYNFSKIQQIENDFINNFVFDFFNKYCLIDENNNIHIKLEEFLNLHQAIKNRLLLLIFKHFQLSHLITSLYIDNILKYIDNNFSTEYFEIIKDKFYIQFITSVNPIKKYKLSNSKIVFLNKKPKILRFISQPYQISLSPNDIKKITTCNLEYEFKLIQFLNIQELIKILQFEIDKNQTFNFIISDIKNISFPIIIRNFKNGDKIYTYGLNKLQKLSDIFINEKIHILIKPHVPIICDSNNNIIAITNLKLSKFVLPLHKINELNINNNGYLVSVTSKEIL